jgi:hypothetical protein
MTMNENPNPLLLLRTSEPQPMWENFLPIHPIMWFGAEVSFSV